jgi:hypothetical protein
MLSARPPIVGEELLGKPGVGVFGGRLSMFDDQKEKGAQARRTVGAQLADDVPTIRGVSWFGDRDDCSAGPSRRLGVRSDEFLAPDESGPT